MLNPDPGVSASDFLPVVLRRENDDVVLHID